MPNGLQGRGPLRRQNGTLFRRHRQPAAKSGSWTSSFRHRELFAYACGAYSRVILHGERKSRISFAEKMREEAFSFPRDQIEPVTALLLTATVARNGWRVMRETTVIRPIRRAITISRK